MSDALLRRRFSIDNDWDSIFTYTINSTATLITDYVGNSANVTIPNAIEGRTVMINSPAFRNDVTMQYVTFSDGVLYTNNSMHAAFMNSNITNVVNIPNTVVDLYAAFYNCHYLVDVGDLPNGITNMYAAFYNCRNLQHISNIPSNVTNMQAAFSTTNLTGTVNLPSSITDLSNGFFYCENIGNIKGNLTNCTNITNAFYRCMNCSSFPSVGDLVTNMAFSFFLTKVSYINHLPSAVINASGAFEFCYYLTNINTTLPNTLVDMSYMFSGCNNLTSAVNVPTNVVNMCGAFAGCYNLSGAMYIFARNVVNADYCFDNHSSSKSLSVYVYTGTATHNAFQQWNGINGITVTTM